MAASLFYVLRGFGGQTSLAWDELSLCGVALLWLPITLGNLVSLRRTRALPFVLAHFGAVSAPPLALLLAIVLATGSLPTA